MIFESRCFRTVDVSSSWTALNVLVLLILVLGHGLLALACKLGRCLGAKMGVDVVVAKEETDLLQGLVLGLREEEVTDDGVGEVGHDVYQEVFPSNRLECQRRLKGKSAKWDKVWTRVHSRLGR